MSTRCGVIMRSSRGSSLEVERLRRRATGEHARTEALPGGATRRWSARSGRSAGPLTSAAGGSVGAGLPAVPSPRLVAGSGRGPWRRCWLRRRRRRRARRDAAVRGRAHAVASGFGELGKHDLPVRFVVGHQSSWVPVPTTRPSSSTTMRSASRMVLTRCATMTTVASAVSRGQRGSQRGVGRVVERGERVVEQVDLRLATSIRAIARRWRWPPETLRAALRDRRVEAARHRLDEVARLRDLERVPELLVGGVRVAVPQVARRRCRRTGRASAAPGRPCAASSAGSSCAHVDAVDEHLALGHVEEPRDQVEQRGLAGAGAADDRGRLRRAGRRRRRRAAPAPGRPGSAKLASRRSSWPRVATSVTGCSARTTWTRCRAPPGCARRRPRRAAPSRT